MKKELSKEEKDQLFISHEYIDLDKLINRMYPIYRLYPNKELWNDLKLLEAIRRRYKELMK